MSDTPLRSSRSRRCALLVRLALLCGGLLVLQHGARAKGTSYSLQSARGRVEIRLGNQNAWTPVKRGMQTAAPGDHLRTGRDGAVHIVSDTGVRLALGPNTEVTLREQNQPRGWRVMVGKVLAVFTRSNSGEVRTPGAVAAAEGTVFQVAVADDGTTELSVVEGTVRFFNDRGSVQVAGAQGSTARVGQAPTRPVAIDPTSLMAWEASLQTLLFDVESPRLSVGQDPLEQQLQRRQEAVTAAPQAPAAQAALAEILLDLHRAAEALPHARLAVDAEAGNGRYHGILGYALLGAGYPAEARSELEAAAAADPGRASWSIGLALDALGQRNALPAIALLQQAAAAVPDDPEPPAYLAAAYLRTGELANAEAAARQAVRLNPAHALANACLAYILLARGQSGPALSAAQTAVAQAPRSALAHEALGSVRFYTGDLPAAASEIGIALTLDPLSASAHLAQARVLAARDDLEQALDEAAQAVALNPQSAPARSTLGVLLLLNNDPLHAERQFAGALAVDPNLAEARSGWGQALQRRGRFREALDQQKAAVSLDTDSASAQNNLGGVYASLGQMAQAIQHLTRAIELQPGWGLPYANLALVYLEENRYREALDAGEKALQLGTRSPFVYTVLARIYLRQDRRDRALAMLRQALALDPRYPQARFQLAQLYLGQNRSRDAEREIVTAVLTDPSAMLETRRYARTEGTLAGGSHDEIAADLRHSGQALQGRLNLYGAGLYDRTAGDRPVNGDLRERFAEVIAGYTSSPTRQLMLFSTALDRRSGLPGPATVLASGDPDDRQDFSGYDAVLGYRQRLSRNVVGMAKYSLRRSRLEYLNPDSLAADDNPFRTFAQTDGRQSAELRAETRLNDATSLWLGYSHNWDTRTFSGLAGVFDPVTGATDFTATAQRTRTQTGTAWIESHRRLSERMDLVLGEYRGSQTGSAGVLLPRVSLLYRPDPRSWWSFIVNPIFRADALQLAPVEALADPRGLDSLNFVEGGSGRSCEMRYQWLGDRANTVTAALAYQAVRGLLIDVQDPSLTGLPTRLLADRGHRWVADAAYEQWLTRTLTGRAWARWQESRGDFPAVALAEAGWPYTPSWQAGARLDYLDEHGYRVGLELLRLGSRYHDPQRTQQVPGFTLVNLRARYQHDLRRSYFAEVLNVLNTAYMLYAGFPQPGRTLRAGIEYRL